MLYKWIALLDELDTCLEGSGDKDNYNENDDNESEDEKKREISTGKNKKVDMNMTIKEEVACAYFYSLSPGQVVLF
jgi:hypothetical protein